LSRKALEIAIRHAETLPAFSDPADAERVLFAYRDRALDLLSEIAGRLPDLVLDDTPETLKRLEQCYFHLHETGGFAAAGCTREQFESCLAMKFGSIAVHAAGARWVVREYFATGRYQLGVEKGNLTYMLSGEFANHYALPGNKRRQALFRTFRHYFV
jgi:hypothetical protein